MRTEVGIAGRALPSGTLTFLFADIEGSTRLVRDLKEGYRASLETYQSIFRRRIAERSGHEIGTEGDSFFVVFERAHDAVRCAVDAQTDMREADWPQRRPLRVRIGIHSGDATERNGNYVGLAVHEAARVAGASNGGQTLVSVATHALSVSSLPADVTFNDAGSHRLKDLESPLRLYEVVAPGIETGPPPNSLNEKSSTLPAQLTPFTGREAELDEIGKLLEDPRTRLLTLSGAGGTGKSRLAIEAASTARSAFRDGVWFVPLAPISSEDVVPSAVAQAIGAIEREGRSAATAVFEELTSKRALIVLDNFEHLLGAGSFVAQLIGSCPDCTVLTTSREPLKISAERLYPVPPMALPSSSDPLEALARNDAIALFVDRVKARDPNFALDASTASLITEICRRLDGLPLAIELAAARASAVGLQELLDQLAQGLSALGGGPDDAPERHRTLDAAIASSYDVLPERLQAIFRAVSVFHGGFDAEAAKDVCHAEPDDLIALADRSLIRRDAESASTRYEMLETIRAFAAGRLEAASERQRVEEAHAAHFQRVAQRASDRLHTVDAAAWLDRLTADHDNLRSALDHYDRINATAELAMMTSALMEFWSIRGFLHEGAERLERALERSSQDSIERAQAVVALARFKRAGPTQSCPKDHVPLLIESWTIAEGAGDKGLSAWILALLAPHAPNHASDFATSFHRTFIDGGTATVKDKKASPTQVLEQALVFAEQAGDDVLIAEIKAAPWMYKGLGFFRAMAGNPRVLGGSLDDAIARGDNRAAAEILLRQGFGSLAKREEGSRRALDLSREVGDRRLQVQALKRLGDIATRHGDYPASAAYLHEGLEITRADGDLDGEASLLVELFTTAGEVGDKEAGAAILARQNTIRAKERVFTNLMRPVLWRASWRGVRTGLAGLVWSLAFVLTHGTLRTTLLIAAGYILAGRLRDMKYRIKRQLKQYVRVIPSSGLALVALGLGVWVESLRVAAIVLLLLLLLRGRTAGRALGIASVVLSAFGIVLALVTPTEGLIVPAYIVSYLMLITALTSPQSLAWAVFRVGDSAARFGAAFVALDSFASWRSDGAFDLGAWFDVGAVAAIGGLVVAGLSLAVADRRFRVAGVLLAACSAALPIAFARGNDPMALGLGAAFGGVFVLIALLRATEPRPRTIEVYPAHLREPASV